MLRYFFAFPFFILLVIFLFILFLGMLFAFVLQILMRTGRKSRVSYDEPTLFSPYDATRGTYIEIIDIEEKKRKKWITIMTLILIGLGLMLLNYLKIDENGKVFWEKKQKIIEEQDYI